MQYRLTTNFRIDAGGKPVPVTTEADIATAGRYYHQRDFATAAQVCDAILQRRPRDFDTLHLRGVLYLEEKQPDEALGYLRRAEQERPEEPQLIFHIGNALMAKQQPAEAEIAFRRSLALRPRNVDALNNLGNLLSGEKQFAEAIDCFRQALTESPASPQPLFNMGRTLLAMEQPEQAFECFRGAFLRTGPNTEPERLIDLHTSMGVALVELRRYEEALAICRDAPASVAGSPRIQWNASLTLLMLGDYAEGWRKYEYRFQVPDHDAPRDGAVVLNLDAVAGRRVLVFPEQGRGDMIQFARYLPLLAARGARVLVEMYLDLKPLFELIDGVAQVMTPEYPSPEHDLLTPLLSLPAAFHTELGSIPAQVPYLRVPEARMARWTTLLGPRTRPRIGVAWWGSQHIAKRSMPVSTLVPVLRLADVEFHALQKEITPEDQGWLAAHGLVADHSATLEDFADTAALISHMDMVVSIDTSVAHLAGALGKPVWIMLPFSPDWRWLRGRDDSPWYPTARLFRQAQRGDWDDVVRRVADALSGVRFEHEIEGDQHGVVAADQ